MNTVSDVHQAIEQTAQELSGLRSDLISVDKISVGEYVRQGDIYITRVSDSHGCGPILKSFQLAKGESTGSRHLAEGPVTLYRPAVTGNRLKDALAGPVVVATDRWTCAHPEHADMGLPAGTYQVSYQLDHASQQAVRD
jgi:hypothetical protein